MENKPTETIFSKNFTRLLCRMVFVLILIYLFGAGFSNTLVHQLQAPVLKYPRVDPTYWVFHLLHIPEMIASNIYFSWVLDILLFATCIGVLIFPEKKWLVALFIGAYFIYFIIFNSFVAHHNHFQVPVLIAPIPFLFSGKSFSLSWQALRYFTLFTYSSAFLWKFFRLSWLHANQGVLIVKKNLAAYLYFNPDTLLAGVYFWFFNHPVWLQIIFLTGFLIEGAFMIGFFTKKFDRYLFWFSLLLPIGFWFTADVPFFAQVILSLTLLPINFRLKYYRKGSGGLMKYE